MQPFTTPTTPNSVAFPIITKANHVAGSAMCYESARLMFLCHYLYDNSDDLILESGKELLNTLKLSLGTQNRIDDEIIDLCEQYLIDCISGSSQRQLYQHHMKFRQLNNESHEHLIQGAESNELLRYFDVSGRQAQQGYPCLNYNTPGAIREFVTTHARRDPYIILNNGHEVFIHNIYTPGQNVMVLFDDIDVANPMGRFI